MTGAGFGAALALTAAAGSLAVGIPLHPVGLPVLLLAVLLATRWWGRRAGQAATGTGTIVALGLLPVYAETTPEAMDVVAVGLLAAVGTGIAAWIGPRETTVDRGAADPRRLKEEFLATVSHELRTPLNAILGWTELLRAPRVLPSQDVDHGLEVIERNARRQLALVDELLAVVDPDVPADAWDRVDICAMMRGLLDGLQPIAAAARVRLSEEATVAEGVPWASGPMWVRGDADGLRVALRHILDNAVKFTPAGGRVRTGIRQLGDRVLIFITDSGPGIAPAHLNRVFEPFTQSDTSSTRPHGGLGLGLTIARKLIEKHGGHVDLRSDTAAGGSTFLVTLPALPPGT
jgi:signal transduction histidine kinase